MFLFDSIADHSDRNLMKASNLGVVFGPTLMRPEHETVASIVDIRYQNIIVELMITRIDEVCGIWIEITWKVCTCMSFLSYM